MLPILLLVATVTPANHDVEVSLAISSAICKSKNESACKTKADCTNGTCKTKADCTNGTCTPKVQKCDKASCDCGCESGNACTCAAKTPVRILRTHFRMANGQVMFRDQVISEQKFQELIRNRQISPVQQSMPMQSMPQFQQMQSMPQFRPMQSMPQFQQMQSMPSCRSCGT